MFMFLILMRLDGKLKHVGIISILFYIIIIIAVDNMVCMTLYHFYLLGQKWVNMFFFYQCSINMHTYYKYSYTSAMFNN
jgi:hypothetical protein